jgi:hypothetical protein
VSEGAANLSDTLERLRRRERIRPMWLVRNSGVSRSALRAVRIGRTAHPKPETVEQIARGLATDPYTFELDQRIYADVLGERRAAAGGGA